MKTKLLLLFLFLTFTLQAQTNLVPNGDFENWTSSSQPDKWFRSFSGLVFQSTSAQNGSSSTKMQITSGTLNFINSEFFPVVAGKTYRITMYHKLVTGTFSAIELSLYHQPGTFKEEIAKKTTAVTSSTEWRKLEFDYTPTVSESIEVDIWTTGTLNSEILVDNVSVVDIAEPVQQYTIIPDVNFEKKLIELGHDSGTPDGKVLTNNINKLTVLNVSSSGIEDLKGIQDFVKLTHLICDSNKLKNINFSTLVDLNLLNCSYNQLTSLDISVNNNFLDVLYCESNQLTSLNVSKNKSLGILRCSKNKLTTLDVTNNNKLRELDCGNNILTTLDVSKNITLQTFYCNNNQLTTIDVSKNIALVNFSCSNNQIKNLDVSNNLNLEGLSCNSNQLTNLEISSNTKLINLNFRSNQVENINITNNELLTFVDCSFNLLTTIDVSKAVKLINFICNKNNLMSIDFKNNLSLRYLSCDNNKLLTLDISRNKDIIVLDCSSNLLKSLNLKNGNNKNFTSGVGSAGFFVNLSFKNNTNLQCIEVDDAAQFSLKWNSVKDNTASYSSDCTLYTLIPDTNFEQKLIDLGIDTDGKNGKVLTSSIVSLTKLNVSNSSITNLTGIEDFISLTELVCETNGLTTINLAKNQALLSLDCSNNKLTSLDVTKNVNLKTLYCSNNELTTLNVSLNKNLTELSCNSNKLSALDVTKNTTLTSLSCGTNQLKTLDVSKNVQLQSLSTSQNLLEQLNVTTNTKLESIVCNNNLLSTLDLSKNVKITTIDCSYNTLKSLNLRNGNNAFGAGMMFVKNFTNNPALTCIEVDDANYSNTKWPFYKDATASYSTDCKFSLPSNNFAIESKGETCLNSNNGEINITATAAYGYKATINATPYTFANNSLKVTNLAPGTYKVTITIPGETFEQIFTIVIPKGATITGKSSLSAEKVAVEIATGTAPYTVFLNGVEQFETNATSFTVDAKTGGLLEVKTAKACEGIYAKDIAALTGTVSAFPNPTSGAFEIEIPATNKEVSISIYSLEGQLISNKIYTVENGKVQLSLENQPEGIYMTKVEFDRPVYVKIIKK